MNDFKESLIVKDKPKRNKDSEENNKDKVIDRTQEFEELMQRRNEDQWYK